VLCQAPHSTTPSPYADVRSDKLNSLLASDDDLSEPEEVPTAPTRVLLFFLLCAQHRILPQWTPKRASEQSHEAALTLALGQAAEASCGGAHTACAARFSCGARRIRRLPNDSLSGGTACPAPGWHGTPIHRLVSAMKSDSRDGDPAR